MKPSAPERSLPRLLSALLLLALALLPFHAFLTVWGASLLGHYTLLRLWKEVVFSFLGFGCLYILWRNTELRARLLAQKWFLLVCMFAGVQLLWAVVAYHLHSVSAKALAYGLLIDLRLFVALIIGWIVAAAGPSLSKRWQPWLFWPAAIVAIIGLLEYFLLPFDALKHFGYSQATIYPYETINHNIHYPRIMSTLRGANPLGAYLLLVLTLLVAVWRRKRRFQLEALAAVCLVVLVLTFSRSAWIGLLLAVAIIAGRWLPAGKARKGIVIGIGIGVAVAVLGAVALRHNTGFENAFLHTQEHSAVKTSSNQGHASALRGGLHDLVHQLLGRGPGTAGPASAYNAHGGARIAENFFIQIGQETGWLGLLLFTAINISVGRQLWRRRGEPLALGLFAALIGLSFVNLLSHAWSDDTLAYLFWTLAGIALAENVSIETKTALAHSSSRTRFGISITPRNSPYLRLGQKHGENAAQTHKQSRQKRHSQ